MRSRKRRSRHPKSSWHKSLPSEDPGVLTSERDGASGTGRPTVARALVSTGGEAWGARTAWDGPAPTWSDAARDATVSVCRD